MTEVKVLVVEDNLLNMELVADLLEVTGYRVLQAGTAEPGMALAQAESPHLILMDISLPGMDGLAATVALRRDRVTANIPIVALTAHALPGDEERLLAIGCNGYIPKPIATQQLARLVAAFVKRNGSP